jgi:hypothetical protein
LLGWAGFRYFIWITVYFAVFAPMLFLRARREEQALAAEFDKQCQEYCHRVPAFFPRYHSETETQPNVKREMAVVQAPNLDTSSPNHYHIIT